VGSNACEIGYCASHGGINCCVNESKRCTQTHTIIGRNVQEVEDELHD